MFEHSGVLTSKHAWIQFLGYFKFVDGVAPLNIKIENFREAVNPDRTENFVRQFMHPGFFGHSFFVFCIEALQKLAESHDVYEFMGEDVQGKREKLQLFIGIYCRKDFVILQADFVIVIGGGPQRGVFETTFIADNLGEWTWNDLIR